MAAAAAVLGGMVGFFMAVPAWIFFHYSALQSLGLWTGSGLFVAAVLILLAKTQRQAETAPRAGLPHPSRVTG